MNKGSTASMRIKRSHVNTGKQMRTNKDEHTTTNKTYTNKHTLTYTHTHTHTHTQPVETSKQPQANNQENIQTDTFNKPTNHKPTKQTNNQTTKPTKQTHRQTNTHAPPTNKHANTNNSTYTKEHARQINKHTN